MSEKPEALRLANALRDGTYLLSAERDATEAVLRTQHAEIERLRDELRQSSIDHTRAEVERLQEALALAERLAAGRLALVEQLTDEVGALRRNAERLREALKLALNSHGGMLISDPPQDAWKFYRVDEIIVAALRREET